VSHALQSLLKATSPSPPAKPCYHTAVQTDGVVDVFSCPLFGGDSFSQGRLSVPFKVIPLPCTFLLAVFSWGRLQLQEEFPGLLLRPSTSPVDLTCFPPAAGCCLVDPFLSTSFAKQNSSCLLCLRRPRASRTSCLHLPLYPLWIRPPVLFFPALPFSAPPLVFKLFQVAPPFPGLRRCMVRTVFPDPRERVTVSPRKSEMVPDGSPPRRSIVSSPLFN